MRDDNPATERQTRQAIRDDIYERIRRGDLGPAEGEAEAASLGLKPFENIPAEGEFDPFEAARWSLPMAFAWAMWGTRASVRRHWQAYREADLRWRPCDLVAPSGPIAALLGPLRPTSALDLTLEYTSDPGLRSFDKAERQLTALFETGRVKLDGINNRTGEREDLAPSKNWRGVFTIQEHNGRWWVQGASASYSDVEISRDDLRDCLPGLEGVEAEPVAVAPVDLVAPVEGDTLEEPTRRPISEAELRRWMTRYFAEVKDSWPPPNRDHAVDYMRKACPEKFIRKKRVYAIRSEMIDPEWKKGGRRPRVRRA